MCITFLEMNNTGTNTINRNYLHKVCMVMTCVYALSMHTMTAQISQSSENDTHKKSWGIHLSLPHINHFHLKPPIEQVRKTNTGFWGVAMGVDYFYSSHSYFTEIWIFLFQYQLHQALKAISSSCLRCMDH